MDSSVIYSLGLGMQVNIKRTDGKSRFYVIYRKSLWQHCGVSIDVGRLEEERHREKKKGRF